MIRALVSLVAAILSALAFVTVNAQDDTVVRVDYVAVLVQADGTESPHSEGAHYIASDGRYRRDETPAGGTPTSEYRLPRDAVHVSVNHSLLEAVRSGRIPPVNVASPVGRSLPTPPAGTETTEIGERTLVSCVRSCFAVAGACDTAARAPFACRYGPIRYRVTLGLLRTDLQFGTLGPIRLQRRAQVREGTGRTQYWAHDPPLMEDCGSARISADRHRDDHLHGHRRALRGSSDFGSTHSARAGHLHGSRPCPLSSPFRRPLSRAPGRQFPCASRDRPSRPRDARPERRKRDQGNPPAAHLCAVAADTPITGVKQRGRSWSRIADRDVGHLDDGMPAW